MVKVGDCYHWCYRNVVPKDYATYIMIRNIKGDSVSYTYVVTYFTTGGVERSTRCLEDLPTWEEEIKKGWLRPVPELIRIKYFGE